MGVIFRVCVPLVGILGYFVFPSCEVVGEIKNQNLIKGRCFFFSLECAAVLVCCLLSSDAHPLRFVLTFALLLTRRMLCGSELQQFM